MAKSAVLAGLVLAYGLQRRRDERAIAGDREWEELRRPLPSAPLDVTSADGTRLHVEVFGRESGPTILLVHGWCCSVRFWHYQLRDLADQYRIVAYDLRGHGRSQRRVRDYSPAALAADLDAVLRASTSSGERVVVAAHSMGGMSLVAWAGAHPSEVRQRLAGAVLVDTGMGQLVARSRIGPRISALSRARTALGRLVLGVPLPLPGPPDPLLYRTIRFIALGRSARPAHVAFCAQMVAECPAQVRAGFGMTLAGLDLTDCLARLVVPTAVLVGTEDVLTPLEQAQLIAEAVPDAQLFELPGRGHMAPVEGHDDVTRHIRAMANETLVPGGSEY